MELKIIKSDRQHRQYLAEAESLAAADPRIGTPAGDRIELLGMLIDKYERERYPFEDPDPIAVLRFRMEAQGLLQKDLAPLLGGKNRVSEVLAGKRPLTVAMIRALSEGLRIPAELLIGRPQKKPLEARQKRVGYRVRKG